MGGVAVQWQAADNLWQAAIKFQFCLQLRDNLSQGVGSGNISSWQTAADEKNIDSGNDVAGWNRAG